MERDPIYIRLACLPLHFNSHAHVERDHRDEAVKILKDISTHTLTWSVTRCINAIEDIRNISTHTLTWSVTEEVME